MVILQHFLPHWNVLFAAEQTHLILMVVEPRLVISARLLERVRQAGADVCELGSQIRNRPGDFDQIPGRNQRLLVSRESLSIKV